MLNTLALVYDKKDTFLLSLHMLQCLGIMYEVYDMVVCYQYSLPGMHVSHSSVLDGATSAVLSRTTSAHQA